MRRYINLILFLFAISFNAAAAGIDGTSLLFERTQQLLSEGNWIYESPSQGVRQPPKVGVSQQFYAVDFGNNYQAYTVETTCRGIGRYCYIFVEDSQWENQKVTQKDVTQILAAFDEQTPADSNRGIYQIEAEVFGQPPDEFDNDPRIYILILDIQDGKKEDSYIAGYFDPLNQEHGGVFLPFVGMQFHSNEVELLYLDCNPLAVSSEKAAGVVAHELQHLIHWKYDKVEEIWINEGCSEYARVILCGYDKTTYIKAFEHFPDISLINWDSTLAHYGAAFLWMLYLHEQYGGTDIIAALAKNPLHGILGVNDTLLSQGYSVKFDSIFHDWQIANYLDDENFKSGQYGYRYVTLRTKPTRQHTAYPIQNTSGKVNPWACDYIELTKDGSGQLLELTSQTFSPLSFSLILMKQNEPFHVQLMTIDSETGWSQVSIPRFGVECQRLVLIPSYVPESEKAIHSVSYSYSACLEDAPKPIITVTHDITAPEYIDIAVKMDADIYNECFITLKKQNVVVASGQMMKNNTGYLYRINVQPDWKDTELLWEIRTPDNIIGSGKMWVTYILSAAGGEISRNENLKLEIPAYATGDMPLTVIPIQENVSSPESELIPVGTAYRIGPVGLHLEKEAKLMFRANSQPFVNPSCIAIYRWDEVNQKFEYTQSQMKEAYYSAMVKQGGVYCLQADTVIPKFSNLYVDINGQTLSINGMVSDQGSGIRENSLQITVNGQKIKTQLHDNHFSTSIALTNREIYYVSVKIEDRVGNIATVKKDIKVKPVHEEVARSCLGQNYPNPANPETWIPYYLEAPAYVTIRIYNSAGQLIRTLHLGYKAAGVYETKAYAAYWDGRNNSGDVVASGIYFYVFSVGNFTEMKKLVLIR